VRRPLLVVLTCAAIAVAAGSARAGTDHSAAGCRKPFQRAHDRAVFGHFATLGAAKALAARAKQVGFQGIKIYDNGCGDFDVLIDGADKTADRVSFALEAQKAGFPITFEQTAPPLQLKPGYTYGVLGTFRDIAAANKLSWRLASVNFHYIEIAYQNGKWLVVMPAVPIKNALSIAASVHQAGFHIAFNTG
jgi:hypothetical protein